MRRHDLAWLAPDVAALARLSGASCTPEHTARALLGDWIRLGHPLIVTRQPPGSGEEISLGLALPPARGKARLAFLVPRAGVRRTTSPPALAWASERLPQAWQPKLRAMLASREVAGAAVRIYGSAGMEILTGESSRSSLRSRPVPHAAHVGNRRGRRGSAGENRRGGRGAAARRRDLEPGRDCRSLARTRDATRNAC